MMVRLFAALGLMLIVGAGMVGGAQALFVEKPLEDPVEEARAQRLMKELRCLVCQNQAISESNAGLAQDLRVLLRERLAAGDTDRQAMDYMVARYGDWVLLDPPVKASTYVLWAGPAGIVLVGIVILIVFVRRRDGGGAYAGAGPAGDTGSGGGTTRAAALTEAERAELDQLMKQTDNDGRGNHQDTDRDNKGA